MENDAIRSAPLGEVLVVDDTPESLAYLCALLDGAGYSVRAAPGGELALWTVAGRLPDLILLDVRMPDIDGFEVCRRLKADPRTAMVPVIFLSAQSDVEDKVQGFRAGGIDYIGKPFASEEVLQRVATHVKLAQVSAALAAEKLSLEERVRQRTAELEATTQSLRAEVAAHNAAEDKLRLAASAFDTSLSSMFITDLGGLIVAVNPSFTQAAGYSAEECIGQHIGLLNSSKHEPAFFQSLWQQVESEGRWSGEIWNRRKDGNEFPCFQALAAVKDGGGAIINFVGGFHDLSENKDAQTLIDFLTHHDSLTGLPNRILVRHQFGQLIAAAGAADTIAVLCINLDRFRFINDFYGYTTGNEVLQRVAGILLDNLSGENSIFREGADEFIVVHREPAGLLGIRMLIDALLGRLNAQMQIDSAVIDIAASIGVAMYPDDGKSMEELVANAAIAMARAKQHDSEPYAFFTEEIDQGVRVRFDIAQRLRHALGRKEFEVVYQPQVDADSGRVVSAEALLRWCTPELGAVSPARFIPIAEETGAIVDIGHWVLQTVCAQIAQWRAQGHTEIKIAVNLSARQFGRFDLCERIEAALADAAIPPSALELEITESAIIDDVAGAIATMSKLKAIGVTLAMDDFGTGYSSLSYLKKFPIDYLKIDQSFVRDLLTEPDADAIVLSILGLAENMRMKVIAEGVETAAQQDFLATHRCHLLQGYLFSKPVAPKDFIAHYARTR